MDARTLKFGFFFKLLKKRFNYKVIKEIVTSYQMRLDNPTFG